MSSMPSNVYLEVGVFVMEEEYVLSLFPAFEYSRSLLKKNSTGIGLPSRVDLSKLDSIPPYCTPIQYSFYRYL
ncbi:hypothetical protein Tco_0369174 [Tanacetum coccineum]